MYSPAALIAGTTATVRSGFSTAPLAPLMLALLLPHAAAATTAVIKVSAARARWTRCLADGAGAWRGAAGIGIIVGPSWATGRTRRPGGTWARDARPPH